MTITRELQKVTKRALLLRSVTLAVGAVLGAQVTVVAGLVALDAWRNRGRKAREAPQPGTFSAHVQQAEITIYTSGATLYDDMIEAIDSAEHTIHLETFIWKGDEVGQRFLDAVNAAAERGVEVFVIYDGFANLVVSPRFYQFSDKVRVYRIPFLLRKFWKSPVRYSGTNHSKILIVDDRIGFVGGYNIGSLYARHWRDTHIREAGPAVWGLRNAIANKWNAERATEDQIGWIPPESWNPAVRTAANLPIHLVYPIRNVYLNGIERARDHIWITTPYFIPDQQILEALIAAAGRGVDVRVMVPKNSNHLTADWVSRGFYGQLLDAGITILLYKAAMIHAKTATIDRQWSTVGTANIDRMSLSFNYETNVEIVDASFAEEMEKVFLADAEHCEELTSPSWRDRHPMARVAETVLIPLRPFL